MVDSRRNFIKNTVKATAAVSIGGILPSFSAKSYARIIGANERVMVASMGVNSRGAALGANFAKQENCEVLYVCDVDSRAAAKFSAEIQKITGKAPKSQGDFRKALEDKDLDALIVAAPDHWHAPAAILACKAGKHVYLEKPCSHSPQEGELLIAAAKKYDRLLQMGNQRRSWTKVVDAITELKSGVIGRPYFAKTWYTNNRPSIGIGKEVPVPEWLDYELWQGPAPRRKYKDNVVHYNWHWFWNWGTGEALNNGTHMVDIARWGLEVDYPVRVSSNGGRYRYQDDWETPDTQVINMEFKNNTMMTWEGRSCNGKLIEGSSVGVMFYADKGSMLIKGNNAYTIFDLEDKIIKQVDSTDNIDARDRVNPAERLDAFHLVNFLDAIRKGTKLNSDIVSGHQSTLLVQLGNIALRSGNTLNINPENGHIIGDKEASKYWRREYAPGWEPKV